ncbi:MAG: CopG family transcriptional regulator [Firmicutes bacterium]|nr:CopG family transcriptional regulator [Bacillota bacterium]
MTISVRLNDADAELIKQYAELNHISVSELVRQAVMEKIEEDYDLAMYYEAKAEHEKNPVTYSHEEVKKMLELEP